MIKVIIKWTNDPPENAGYIVVSELGVLPPAPADYHYRGRDPQRLQQIGHRAIEYHYPRLRRRAYSILVEPRSRGGAAR